MVVAIAILTVLLLDPTSTTWPGLLIVLTGIPLYLWRRKDGGRTTAAPANE